MNDFFNKFKTEYEFRTYVFAVLSMTVSFIFAVFNTVLAVIYNAAWNFGIAIYYFLLVSAKSVTCGCEVKWYKAGIDEGLKVQKRKNLYFAQSIVLLILDLALVAPISIMVEQRKDVNYSMIAAIGMAAFTTFKIVTSARGFVKTRKNYGVGVKILKNLTFIEALVSVLVLQYTMVMTFGEGVQGDMFVLCAVTSFAIWALVVVVSVLSLINSIKLRKN